MIKPWFTFMPSPAWNVPDSAPSTPPATTPPPASEPPANTPPASTPPASTPPASARTAPPPTAATADPNAPAPTTPADWPSDWREKMATGADGKVDAKELERLKRLPAPTEAWKSYRALENRLNSGKPNADEPMPQDAEAAKAWRTARDIPAEPTGYTLPDELKGKLIDADKPVLNNFYEYAHQKNMPQAQVQANVEWYLNLQEQSAEAQNAADKAAASEAQETLMRDWGADYKPNLEVASRYAKEALGGVDLLDARLPDGRRVGNVPDLVKGLAKIGLDVYGDVAFAGGEKANATENRMKELKRIMDTEFDKWNASPALRAEYFQLLEASDKRNARPA